ncbi:MAG: hypothetical protein IIB69_13845 [Proteobacteria bacterium]|nr:hypothetical protein [Pseudomonadota bacterium]
MSKTFRLTGVDFTNNTATGLSRNPGAKVCAEIHRITSDQLRIITAAQGVIADGGVVLPEGWEQPLDVLGIKPAAIFIHK